MLAIEIDNVQLVSTLQKEFKSIDKIKEYLHNLVLEDLEDRELAKLIASGDKKEFVPKDEILKTLHSIAK